MVATYSPVTSSPDVNPFFDDTSLSELNDYGFTILHSAVLGDSNTLKMHDELMNAGNWQQSLRTDTQHVAALDNENTALSNAFDVLDAHLRKESPIDIGSVATRRITGLAIPPASRLAIHTDNPDILGINRVIVSQARAVGEWTLRVWAPGVSVEETLKKKPFELGFTTQATVVALFRAKTNFDVFRNRAPELPPHEIINQANTVRLSANAMSVREQ